MSDCCHVQIKKYIDGSVSGYLDPRGIRLGMSHKQVAPSCKEVDINPFLAGDDEYTPEFPYAKDLVDTPYLCTFEPWINPEDEARKKEENKIRANRRARGNVRDIACSSLWRYFVTLTISPDSGVDRYNYEDCIKCLKLILKNLRNRFPGIRYVFVPEQHEDGAWHFHGLIGGCNLTEMLSDSGHKTRKTHMTIYNFHCGWKWGFSNVSMVYKQGAVGRYISKYITKDMVVPDGKQHYFASNNIPRTKDIVERYVIDFDCPDVLEVIKSGIFTDGIIPDRVRQVYVPVLGRFVYYFEVFGSEDVLCD